jgi:hypothetical protein
MDDQVLRKLEEILRKFRDPITDDIPEYFLGDEAKEHRIRALQLEMTIKQKEEDLEFLKMLHEREINKSMKEIELLRAAQEIFKTKK